jgi:hypothetical protein
MPTPLLILAALLAGSLGFFAWRFLRRRHLDRLVIPYLLQTGKHRAPRRGEEVHLLLCIADHYEPNTGKVTEDVARARVARWVEEYPRRLGGFRDSDGRPPRHTFFYPIEDYHAEHLDTLAVLCRDGFGEVEIHLHHDNDSAAHLTELLARSRDVFAERHGLLGRQRDTGAPAYGFIHGNWALCNSHPGGRNCGVNNELEILRDTGCYADFTMPSAPHPTQTWKINSIYYASDRPGRGWSHNTGVDAGTRPAPPGSLLLIQGPLVLDWTHAKWGLVPRLENGCLQGSQPPHIERVDNWLRARVQVRGRPDWFFVKLHAHGALESSHDALFGDAAVRFHEDLARRAAEDPHFHYHYVTAREMYNLAKAAEAGWTGSVADARDYLLLSNCGAPATAAS